MELSRCWGVAENGEVVEVALNQNLIAGLTHRWPPLGLTRHLEPQGPVVARFGLSDTWLIVPDQEDSGSNPSPKAWNELESQLALFAVNRLEHLVPIHSAAITKNDLVLIVPGASMAGKSTLAFAAHQVGATVLSDEFTLVDPRTGLVTGWNRPIRHRNIDGSTTLIDVAKASKPLPVGLIALVKYESAGDSWEIVSPADAAIALLSHSLSTRSRPNDTLDAIILIAKAAPTIIGTRGPATITIQKLLEQMANLANS